MLIRVDYLFVAVTIYLIDDIFADSPFTVDLTCLSKQFRIAALSCDECTYTSHAPTEEKDVCLPCGNGTTYDSTKSECTCDAGDNYFLADITTSEKVCSKCPTGYYIDTQVSYYTCMECVSPMVLTDSTTCSCVSPNVTTLNGASCVTSSQATSITSKYPVSDSISYTVYDIYSSDAATSSSSYTVSNSAVFNHYFLDAAANCFQAVDATSGVFDVDDGKATESCQILANLCVLAMYNPKENVCALWQNITSLVSGITNGFSSWKLGLPWLYVGTASTLIDSTLMELTIELFEESQGRISIYETNTTTKINVLTIILLKYAMNGTMIGFELLTDQLQFCDGFDFDQRRWRRIGNQFENLCDFDLQKLTDTSLEEYYGDTTFYELYYIDKDYKWFPIGVKILNYRNAAGNQPNIKSDGTEDLTTNSINVCSFIQSFFTFD